MEIQDIWGYKISVINIAAVDNTFFQRNIFLKYAMFLFGKSVIAAKRKRTVIFI